jgi:hypothetical protein
MPGYLETRELDQGESATGSLPLWEETKWTTREQQMRIMRWLMLNKFSKMTLTGTHTFDAVTVVKSVRHEQASSSAWPLVIRYPFSKGVSSGS